MPISLRDNRIRRLCTDALLCVFAIMLSYLESLLPLQLLLPLPGFRLGLANIAVMVTFCLISRTDAAIVSAVRILLMGLLFGSATSLCFSALGGLFSYLTLLLLSVCGRRMSMLGVSVLCAAAHNCGQMLAAALLFDPSLLFSYLPALLLASVLYGGAVGVLLHLALPKLRHVLARVR